MNPRPHELSEGGRGGSETSDIKSGVRVRVVLENRRAGWTRSLVAVGAVAATIIIVGEWVEDQMSGGFLKNRP